MQIRYGYEITITCQQPTAIVCLLSIRDERTQDLIADEQFIATPASKATLYHDLFGNVCRRFTAPAGDSTIRADGTMTDSGAHDPLDLEALETPTSDLPDACLVYLMGSRYCETDRLSQIAWNLFGNVPPGWGRVQAICDFTNKHITFNYNDARSTRTAFEAYQEGIGVCRDYAHLAIALCRCMNIPARYVNGYLGDIGVPVVDPMDFSAWIEVFIGNRWMTFDPRNNIPRIGRITVARGRDAADVPLIISFGPHYLKSFKVWAYDIAAPIKELPPVLSADGKVRRLPSKTKVKITPTAAKAPPKATVKTAAKTAAKETVKAPPKATMKTAAKTAKPASNAEKKPASRSRGL